MGKTPRNVVFGLTLQRIHPMAQAHLESLLVPKGLEGAGSRVPCHVSPGPSGESSEPASASLTAHNQAKHASPSYSTHEAPRPGLTSLTFINSFNKYYVHPWPYSRCEGYSRDCYRSNPSPLRLTLQDNRESRLTRSGGGRKGMKIILLGECDVPVVMDRTSLKRPVELLTLLRGKRLRAWPLYTPPAPPAPPCLFSLLQLSALCPSSGYISFL